MDNLRTPSYLEDQISQIPALKLLINMGYEYLSPEEALKLRGAKNSNVILEDILEANLRRINQINFRGETHEFSDSNISSAIRSLKEITYDGLVRSNEKIYDLLTLGKGMEQAIFGDKKSFTLNYIDWKNPENNSFHVTQEFEISRSGSFKTRRPDIVLFVNGIPFVVIECKRPDLVDKDPLEEAISQQIRNQKEDEIPKLFLYSQILLAIATNSGKYGATGTISKFWANWKEFTDNDDQISELINKSIVEDTWNKVLKDEGNEVKKYFKNQEPRLPNLQDRLLFSLCSPKRLLELTYQFIVFDFGDKKVARYQQYFAVKDTLKKISHVSGGIRDGGVIWHTQGSGKSLTMVMLAKAIALSKEIQNPKIILVTDRTDLDDQLYGTFKACGVELTQAKTGKHLLETLESNKGNIITTLVNKFQAGLKSKKFKDESNNIFVLVDESHRTQYGSLNAEMQRVLPNACYIAFTGTPLRSKDKNTAKQFKGYIGRPYTLKDAVEDQATLPLLYEARHVPQTVNGDTIDKWFERITENLSSEEKRDLKNKFSTSDTLNTADQKVKVIAYDISEHFKNNWQGTGFKAQLVTPNKKTALLYKKYLDECGFVSSEVLISSPDTREGHDDPNEETVDEVQKFWTKMMNRFGTTEAYEDGIINSFKKSDEPEIIIVVDKLLTGFDSPRNTTLYLTRSLKDHTLLQAIARVNRLAEGKEHGYIIDYYGVLENLDKALKDYSNWEDFAFEDIAGSITNISEETNKLPQKHAELWDIFKTISNKEDVEEFERFLQDEAVRHEFYEKLSSFARILKLCLSTVKFLEETSPGKISKYKKDLSFFLNLKTSVQRRYAEKVDFKEYESRIKKLVDTYVTSDEVTTLTELVNIFDTEKFEAEVEKVVGEAAKADTIAHRMKKTIIEKMPEDPAYYKRFSMLLEQTIKEYRDRRITEAEYLARIKKQLEELVSRKGDRVPEELQNSPAAMAFYGAIFEILNAINFESDNKKSEESKKIALEIDQIIRRYLVVDWEMKDDVQNQMKNAIDDYIFELSKADGMSFSVDVIDQILDSSLQIAKHHYV